MFRSTKRGGAATAAAPRPLMGRSDNSIILALKPMAGIEQPRRQRLAVDASIGERGPQSRAALRQGRPNTGAAVSSNDNELRARLRGYTGPQQPDPVGPQKPKILPSSMVEAVARVHAPEMKMGRTWISFHVEC